MAKEAKGRPGSPRHPPRRLCELMNNPDPEPTDGQDMSDADLTDVLRNWPYIPGQINARQIQGLDGRTKIQMRIDLGVLQMEAEGRPDGERPNGFDSLLDYHRHRLQQYEQQHGTTDGFTIDAEQCGRLREEAVQYYHRYVALYALRDLEGVIHDTQRNLEVFDFCRQYGEMETDRTILEQFRPQLIMMRTRCAAELAVRAERPAEAKAVIDRGLAQIRDAYEQSDNLDAYEEANEVQLLRGMRDVLVPKLPASQRQELLERLHAALDAENYELAAILRDELKML